MQAFTKTYKKATHLFHENDHSRELYIVQSGRVRVYRKIGAREVDLARLSKGAVLGEMALIDGKPRSASAVATEDTTVIMIDSETFDKRIISGVPSWFLSMIRTTSEKIRKANSRLEALQSGSHCLHVVLALQYYFLRYGASPSDPGKSLTRDSKEGGASPSSKEGGAQKSLDVAQTVSQLIQLLSVNYQCVMQIFDTLQKKGVTDIKDGRILLCDHAKLDGCCDFLRLLFRKAFEKTGKVSAPASALVCALQEIVAASSSNEKGYKEIAAGDMAAACSKDGAEARALETVNELKELGIVSYVKQAAASASDPGKSLKRDSKEGPADETVFAGYQFFIDPDAFARLLLYCTYKDMVPAL